MIVRSDIPRPPRRQHRGDSRFLMPSESLEQCWVHCSSDSEPSTPPRGGADSEEIEGVQDDNETL